MAQNWIIRDKYPSLLDFDKQNQVENLNLTQIYGIEKVCSDTQLRRVLDTVDPINLRQVEILHLVLLIKI